MLKIVFLCIFVAVSSAHSLKAFASQEGEFLNIKSYFYGNSPCRECEVSVILENKEVAFKTKTDENGNAKIKIEYPKFEILVNGGLGHEKRLKFESKIDKNTTLTQNKKNKDDTAKDVLYFAIAIVLIFVFFGVLKLIKR